MTYYVGQTIESLENSYAKRFFYGLRRDENGTVYLQKADQVSGNDSIQINASGNIEGNYTDFNEGVDFYEGRNVYHELIYENLVYEQYRWDNRSLFYYINADGDLVVSIGKAYPYTAPDNL